MRRRGQPRRPVAGISASVRTAVEATGNRTDGQEHGQRLWATRQSACDDRQFDEPQSSIKANGLPLGVDHDAHASQPRGHFPREFKHEPQQSGSDPAALVIGRHCEPCQSQNGKGIGGKPALVAKRQLVDHDRARTDCDIPENPRCVSDYVGRANVQAKLVLAGKIAEEPIEIDITARERRADVVRPQGPDLNLHRTVPAAPASAAGDR